MLPLYTGAQVKEMDHAAIASGTLGYALMKRAGLAAFDSIVKRWPGRAICVLCGGGNNGGDGYVVAALAKQAAINVSLYFTTSPDELSGEAKQAAEYARREQVPMFAIDTLPDAAEMADCILIDALLGTGVNGALSTRYTRVIEWLNAVNAPVFAIDVPSGLSSNTGAAVGAVCVKADATMSFIARKCGLYTGDGRTYAGEMLFDAVGVDKTISCMQSPVAYILDAAHIQLKLGRDSNAHKGSHGCVGIVAGAETMAGAALMAGEACLYSGAGLIRMLTNEANLSAAQTRLPELMTQGVSPHHESDRKAFSQALDACTALCIGPGMGRGDWACGLIQLALQRECAKVIDADALNVIASSQVRLSNDNHVLTPHPGEAARLLGVTVPEIQSDRYAAVAELQKRYGGVVILKGAGTLVANGDSIWVVPHGNPGMAVAGMGDVLAGIITALLAQGLSLLESAQLAAVAHSAAADRIVAEQGEIGLRPTELFTYTRLILNGKTDIFSR